MGASRAQDDRFTGASAVHDDATTPKELTAIGLAGLYVLGEPYGIPAFILHILGPDGCVESSPGVRARFIHVDPPLASRRFP